MEKQRIEWEEKRVEKDKLLDLSSKDVASLLPPVVDELVQAEEQKQSLVLSDPLKDFIVFAKHLSLEQKPSVKPGSFLESYSKIHLALYQLSEKVNDHYKAYNQVMEGKEEYKRLFAQEPDKYDAIAEKLNRWVEKANSLIDEYNEGVFISEQVVSQISPLFSASSADSKRYLARHLPLFPYSKEAELSFASALFEPLPPLRDYTAIFEELLEKKSLPKLSALVPLLSMERWEKELLGIEKDYLSYLDGLIQKGFFSLEFDREILSAQLARSPYLIYSVEGVVESLVEERGETLDETACQRIVHRLNILMEEALSTLMFTSVKKSVEFFSIHQGVNQERVKRPISSLFFLENVLELVKSEEWNRKLLEVLSEVSLSLKEKFSGIEQTVNLSLIMTGIQLIAIESQLKGLIYSFAKAVLESKPFVSSFEEQSNGAEYGGRIFEAMKPLFSSEKQTLFSRAVFLQPKFWASELTQKEVGYKLGIKENIPSYRLGRFLELSRVFGFSATQTFKVMKFSPEIRAVEGVIVNAAKEVAQAMGQNPALAVVVVEALLEKAFEGLDWQELKEQSSFIVEQHASIETAVDKELLHRLVEVLNLHYPLLLQRQVIDLQANYLASRFIAILKSAIFEQDNLEAGSSLKQLEEQLALRFQEAIENEDLSLPSAWEKRVAHLFDLFLFSSSKKRELLRKRFSLYSANLSFLTPLKEYVNELAQRESASALELLTAFTRRYFPESLGHLSVHHLTHVVEQTAEKILKKAKESDLVRKGFVKAVQKALYMPSSWYKRSHFLYSVAFFLESSFEQEEKKLLFSLADSLQKGALELQKGLQAESFLWPAAIAFTGDKEASFRQLLANGVQETPYFDQNLLRQVFLERREKDPLLADFFFEEVSRDQDYWLLAMQEALSIEEAQKDWELFSLLADGSEPEKRKGLVKEEDGLFLTLWLEERLLEQDLSECLSEVYAVLPQINLFASPFTLIEKAEDTKEVNSYPILGHTTFKGYLEKLLARAFKAESLSLKQSLLLAKQVSDQTLAQTANFFCSSDFRKILFTSMDQVIFHSSRSLEIEKAFTELKLQKISQSIRITVALRQEIMQKELELALYELGIPLQKLEKKCFEVVRSIFKNFFSFTSLEAFLSFLEMNLVEKGLVASEFAKERLLSMQFGLVLKGEETMREFDYFSFSLQESVRVFQSEFCAYLNPELKEEAKALSEQASEMIFGYRQDVSEQVANPLSCYEQVRKILEKFTPEKRGKGLKSAIDSTIFISAPKFLTLKNLLLPGELFIWQSELQREENRENTRTESNKI